jgi:hypothetical protein
LASDTSSKKRKYEEISNSDSEDHEFTAVEMESAISRREPINDPTLEKRSTTGHCIAARCVSR